MILSRAQRLAQEWRERFAPYCDRIEIAGSVRREKTICKDVELVAIPKGFQFWEAVLDFEAQKLMRRTKGQIRGKYFQFNSLPENETVDFFTANKDSWGLQFLIRTGSRDFSHSILTEANKKGFHSIGGSLFQIENPYDEPPLICPEEADVFRVLGLQWVDPKKREAPYLVAARK